MTRKLNGLEELENEDRVRLLGIIDQFRDLGVNEDISLPQASARVSDKYSPANKFKTACSCW